MPNVTKGARAAQQISDEKRTAGSYRVRAMFLKEKEGPWLFRFVTELDDMVTADTHSYCATKDKPDEYKGDNWPAHMPAVCQNDRMFRVVGPDGTPTSEFEPDYGDCYIHNRDRGKPRGGKFRGDLSTPSTLTYSVAVVREPVTDDKTGKTIGYQDAMVEYTKEDGTVVKIPHFVIIPQSWRNFYSGLEASLFDASTVLGAHDVKVTRKENDFSFAVAQRPDPVLYPGSDAWKERYLAALELVGFSLEEEILRQASPDWYKRWFIEGAVPEGGYGRAEEDDSSEETGPAAQANTPDQAKVDGFREKLKAGRGADAVSGSVID